MSNQEPDFFQQLLNRGAQQHNVAQKQQHHQHQQHQQQQQQQQQQGQQGQMSYLMPQPQQGHTSAHVSPASTPAPRVETSEADAHLRAMMFSSGAVPRILTRSLNVDMANSSGSVHDMLLNGQPRRDVSPIRKPPGVILRGTHCQFDLNTSIVRGIPCQLTIHTKVRNTSTPSQLHRGIQVNQQFIIYGVKPVSRSGNQQGGLIRILDRITGLRALLSGHSAPIFDICACPWDTHMFASVSTDGHCIIWRVESRARQLLSDQIASPSGTSASSSAPLPCIQVCSMQSMRGEYRSIDWHPSLPILACARGPSVEVWDLQDVLSKGGHSGPDAVSSPESSSSATSEHSDEDVEDEVVTVPPCFTNQPADPRLSTLQGHSENVNDLCYSPDGSHLLSAGDDGDLVLWNPDLSQPAVHRWQPDEGRPVNTVYWPRAQGYSIPSADSLCYVQCDSYRNVQVWDIITRTPVCILSLPPGQARQTYQAMVLDSQPYLVIPYNAENSQFGLLIVHMLTRCITGSGPDEGSLPILDPAGCRFDYVTPFSVQHCVLTAVLGDRDTDDRIIEVFCVQSHAIQSYEIETALCRPSVGPTPRAISLSPSSSASALRPQQPLTSASRVNSSSSFASRTSPSSSTIPSPSPVLGSASGQSILSQQYQNSSTTVDSIQTTQLQRSVSIPLPVAVSSLQNVQTDRDQINTSEIVALIREETDRMRRVLSADSIERDRAQSESIVKLLSQINSSIQKAGADNMHQVVCQELRSTLLPEITRCIVAAISESVHLTLSAEVGRQLRSQFQSIPDSLHESIQSAFHASFKDQLLPAFRASFSTMFAQIHNTLQQGLHEQHASCLPELEARFNALHAQLASLNFASSHTAPVQSTGNIQDEVQSLVDNQQFNAAFTRVLNAADQSLVLWLCQKLSPSCVHERGPNECSSPVLLSLAQQLSHSLMAPESTRKLEWLRESLLALSERPRAAPVEEHIPNIIQQVAHNVDQFAVTCVDQPINLDIIRMIRFMCSSLGK